MITIYRPKKLLMVLSPYEKNVLNIGGGENSSIKVVNNFILINF
jgi:hypothetical protein